MPVYISGDERRRAAALAQSLGTKIDDMQSMPMWMLPILEELADRVLALELLAVSARARELLAVTAKEQQAPGVAGNGG